MACSANRARKKEVRNLCWRRGARAKFCYKLSLSSHAEAFELELARALLLQQELLTHASWAKLKPPYSSSHLLEPLGYVSTKGVNQNGEGGHAFIYNFF